MRRNLAGHGCRGWRQWRPGIEDCEALRLACECLSESECNLHEGCLALEAPLRQGSLQECLEQPPEFVTCLAGGDACTDGFTAFGCIYDPSDPQQCYCERGVTNVPGWEIVMDCEVPEGVCGI